MSRIQDAHRAADAAAQRRAHLSTRALLAGLFHLSVCLTRVTFRLRAKLDPTGGAYGERAAA